MYQRVLVPLDGSTRAEQALPIAARLARSEQGVITLLQVIPLSRAGVSANQETASRTETSSAAEWTTATTYLTAIAARQEPIGVRAEIIVRAGEPGEVIPIVAATSDAQLIVICGRAPDDSAQRRTKSVSRHVVHHVEVPVLLLREDRPLRLPPLQASQACALRLLVPLDGSREAEAALAPAAQLLDALGAREYGSLHLVRVIANAGQWRRAARYLARLATRIRAGALTGHPVHVNWSVIPHESPAQALVRVAELGEDEQALMTWSVARDLSAMPGSSDAERPLDQARDETFHTCDLVIMTTHGHGGIRRWMLGSVADEVLRHMRTPLLIVPLKPDMLRAESLTEEPDVEQWQI